MKKALRYGMLGLVLLLTFGLTLAPAQAKGETFMTGFTEWKTTLGGFVGWELSGVALNGQGELVMDSAGTINENDPIPAGTYYGGNFYNGGSYWVGEAVSPEIPVDFNFSELIASWNATTPGGTWIEIQAKAKLGDSWTKWYNLGIWASSSETVRRHSVRLQGDADGYVAVDTLVLSTKKVTAEAFQLKVRLFSIDNIASPNVRYMSAAYSTTAPKKSTTSSGDPAKWGASPLNVPECSQMVYSDGGNVWCSPTSTSMVMGFYGFMPGPCEPRVRAVVSGVYDWIYDGHGNWPFNTAYAATYVSEASVRRFTSMDEIENWVSQGVPVIISFAWQKSDLTGAAVSSSNGHLSVVVGFDSQGNPIVNDPAAATDADVQRTYLRSELEAVWLESSGGTVYIIHN